MIEKIKYPTRPLRFRILNQIVRLAPVSAKYCHNAILLKKTPDKGMPPTAPDGHDFRPATRSDLDFIINHPEALASDVYTRRQNRGDQCYCLSDGKEILSYNWVAFSSCCVLCGFTRGIEFFPLSEGQAFTYDFYTYKSRRGGGLGTLTKNLLVSTLARQGIREIYTLVMPYSTASLKIHLKLGYEPVCIVYGYRILGWNRTFYGKPKNKACLDEWIGDFKAATGSNRKGVN